MMRRLLLWLPRFAVLAMLLISVSCGPNTDQQDVAEAGPEVGKLFELGEVSVTQADLKYYLLDKYSGREEAAVQQQALDELIVQARFTHTALTAGLGQDPVVKSEVARILYLRLKEQRVNPQIQALAASETPETTLRALYDAQADRFQTEEARRVAVLWLNPGLDPQRGKAYKVKLNHARDWFMSNPDLQQSPDLGFSSLSVDYSEHRATRFKGGIVGWLQRSGGASEWNRQVAKIAYLIDSVGQASAVVTAPEGVFLVRLMEVKPAVQIPFESVKKVLDQEYKAGRRQAIEAGFKRSIL
jgi:hypothetical protein